MKVTITPIRKAKSAIYQRLNFIGGLFLPKLIQYLYLKAFEFLKLLTTFALQFTRVWWNW